jgi:prolipoprotein diacylglyceryltransferase
VKLDTTNPFIYIAIVGVLLGARVWHRMARAAQK